MQHGHQGAAARSSARLSQPHATPATASASAAHARSCATRRGVRTQLRRRAAA
jgi:hypothetical protein